MSDRAADQLRDVPRRGRPADGHAEGRLGTHAQIRRVHEERVLAVLREHGALRRSQIAATVGVSRTTLSEIAADLLTRGAIVVVSTDAAQRIGSGRPAELLALDPASGQYLGIDIGHTRIRVAVANAAREVIASGYAARPRTRTVEQATARGLDEVFAVIDRVSADAGAHLTALQGIGIGVLGPQPAQARAMVRAGFAARYDAPQILVDNNTRFAALAEALSGDSQVRDVLYIRLSDGVGGGLVVGGRLVTGGHGLAGELGHVHVEHDDAAALCGCGRTGCLETVASVPAVLARCARRGLVVRDLHELAAAVGRTDPVATDVVGRAAAAVGRVLADAAVLFDPEHVVVGGGLARAVPGFVERVAAAVVAGLRPTSAADLPVVRPARLGDDDGALGAISALCLRSPLLADYLDGRATGTGEHMKTA